jgi:hypothetical protein
VTGLPYGFNGEGRGTGIMIGLQKMGFPKERRRVYDKRHVHVYDSRELSSGSGNIGVVFWWRCYYPSSTPEPFIVTTG